MFCFAPFLSESRSDGNGIGIWFDLVLFTIIKYEIQTS